MLLQVTVAAGLLLVGVKAYQNRKKTQRLVEFLQDPAPGISIDHLAHRGGPRPSLARLIARTTAVSTQAQGLDQNFALSIGALLLTTTGKLFSPWLTLASVPILFYLNFDFIKTGLHELIKERKIGIGVVDAVVASALLIMRQFLIDSLFFVLFYLSQKLLEQTQDRSKQSLINIFGEQPRTVWIKQDEQELEVPFDSLQVGDIVVVSASEVVPVDAVVIDGMASVDQRMLTGESQPVEKGAGDLVFAATFVLSGKIFVQVKSAGSETVAAQIGEILSRTTDFKSSVESQGEAIANKSAIPMLALGAVTLMYMGPASALAVLLAYFGYNMRIIAPISLLNFLRIASRHSILVKDGRALELLKQVDTVIFDKTGTLTQEQFHVGVIDSFSAYSEAELLALAAAAEGKQTHPIARAIRQAATDRQLAIPSIDNAVYEVGFGIKVAIDDRIIRVGSERFMTLEAIAMPPAANALQTSKAQGASSLVYVAIDEQIGGAIELRPIIRLEAQRIIDDLKRRHMKLYIISGDQEKPTHHLAQLLGIEQYFANTLPSEKAALIARLQEEGRSVCFVGDGINDSIALKQANVSISLRGASTIATDTAQIVLMDESLTQLPSLFDLAQELDANMQGNLLASVVPGVICVVGVYFLHFGVLATQLLYFVGLGAGVANAMAPWLSRRADEAK